ncbi:class GN sortase [Ensifer adhaerens]|uniref:Class GN sortase n=1 Tax=Ensifer adhaerens TaxID=106592 RepID=A0A9Q9D8K3_ENSAD|nr:class GN sortase [Ensifer adhaerens]USJ22072.1 class GN sortase [Ensifer adhaerens]
MPECAAVAADKDQSEPRPGFLARLSAVETIVLAIISLIALAGLLLIGKGFYMKAKAEVSQVLLKRTFEAQLHGNPDGKPWPWADFQTAAEISAPRINRSAIVLQGASGEALAFGPALLTTTPLPGDEGTSVIAAHRDTHFRWLKEVNPGDLLVLTRKDGRRFLFRAGESRVARWDESGINASASGHHLALATCWPFDAIEQGPMRYIVDAELIGEASGTADDGLDLEINRF